MKNHVVLYCLATTLLLLDNGITRKDDHTGAPVPVCDEILHSQRCIPPKKFYGKTSLGSVQDLLSHKDHTKIYVRAIPSVNC